MSRGFMCGDGWFDIVWEMSEMLDSVIRRDYPDENVIQPKLFEIKERDGELRVSIEPAALVTNEMQTIVEYAVYRARETCDVCGDFGDLVKKKGMMEVLCHVHGPNRWDIVK